MKRILESSDSSSSNSGGEEEKEEVGVRDSGLPSFLPFFDIVFFFNLLKNSRGRRLLRLPRQTTPLNSSYLLLIFDILFQLNEKI